MNFLLEDGWTIEEHRKGHFIMKLPKKIGSGNSRLYLVDSDDFEGYERTIEPIINITIANIYEINPEDFSFAMRNNGTIWSITFESEAFHKKAIDLEHFLKISASLKTILKTVAEQVILEKGGNKEMVEEYLQGCNLVKMDVDKLQVKMELPAELVFGFEQELLDKKEQKGGECEQERLDEKEEKKETKEEECEQGLLDEKEGKKKTKEELEYVKEQETTYEVKKKKEAGKEWKSDVINQKLQEILCDYSSFFKSEQKKVEQSKEVEIAALKSHLAVHDFIEGMALKQVHFSFFNKDYQKEFTLQIKEPLVEQSIEETDSE
ncbi:MAG: hypothetical protein AB8B69_20105 [Chitinophagales bacterium]